MIKGTDIFKIRTESLIINELKSTPVYKAFIETYVIERGGLKEFKYLDYRFGEKMDFLTQYYSPNKGELLIYEFLSIKEGKEVLKNAYSIDDIIHSKKMLPIAECSTDKYLMLGVGNDNYDKIILEDIHSVNRFTIVAENIFDFISKIEMRYEETINGLPANKFYKNLSEDFWRVKE